MECACLTLHCARGPASHGAAARSRACCARQPNTGTYIHGAARLAKPTARAWCRYWRAHGVISDNMHSTGSQDVPCHANPCSGITVRYAI